MIILVANIGSTSFKYRLLDRDTGAALGQGCIERIGQPGSDCPDYEAAIGRCMSQIAGEGQPLGNLSEVSAIGFKAVHAGPPASVLIVPADEERIVARATAEVIRGR